jgi:hypothetical protein
MALPWLIGAAAVATVGYFEHERREEEEREERRRERRRQEKRERKARENELKKEKFERAKNDFLIKWEVKYKEDFSTTPKYTKIKRVEDEINELETLLLDLKIK